jgi:hypothetical protein
MIRKQKERFAAAKISAPQMRKQKEKPDLPKMGLLQLRLRFSWE